MAAVVKLMCKPIPQVLLVLWALQATAHETWFAGQVTPGATGQQIDLQLTTSEHFPALGTSTEPRNMLRASLLVGDHSVPLLVRDKSAQALNLRGLPGTANAALAIASVKPATIELTGQSVKPYLQELGNPRAIAERYAQHPRWRERYTKNAKTWIRINQGPVPTSYLQPQQLPYELVPQIDPTTLQAGSMLKICAFAYGKLVPGAYLGMVDHAGRETHQTADRSGCTRFRLKHATRYLLHSIHIQAAQQKDVDWESHFASFTVIDTLSQTPAQAALPPLNHY